MVTLWAFVVILTLESPQGLVIQRQEMTFRSLRDCHYAQQFVPEGRPLGDWTVTYSACEPSAAA